MNRALLVIFAGLLSGAAAHFGYFYAHKPCTSTSMACELEWIRDELKLTDAQFAEIKQLHDHSEPKLAALSMEVSEMQRQLAAFEEERRNTDRIDFLEFAQFVEQRRAIDQQCRDSARSLVEATARIMNSTQRESYLNFVSKADPSYRLN
jgi:hypothetical protein